MFIVFVLVITIRSLADAAFALPLLAVWLWCAWYGDKRGWWEFSSDGE
jgi:hypothetical protein